jgi:hypothetical protein
MLLLLFLHLLTLLLHTWPMKKHHLMQHVLLLTHPKALHKQNKTKVGPMLPMSL